MSIDDASTGLSARFCERCAVRMMGVPVKATKAVGVVRGEAVSILATYCSEECKGADR